MAHAQPQERESTMKETMRSFDGGGGGGDSGGGGGRHITHGRDSSGGPPAPSAFKFNAQAPEFVPRSHGATKVPISGYFYPCFHYLGGNGGGIAGGGAASITAQPSDWIFVGDPAQHHHHHDPAAAAAAAAAFFISNPAVQFPINPNPSSSSKNFLTEDLRLKIVKQVEYQFTDMSLLANESISKHISKDPEGYVPISYIASTKKIKALTNNHHLLFQALCSCPKLVVSADGKKVKRKTPFTEKDREELQSRTVVAENLPDDHSYQNIEKIFGVVGTVKAIRICHPQEPNSSRPKGEFLMSNKIHALIEYENADVAEKAVEKLNDERNWRKGLRVRLLLRRSPKSVLKTRRSEFDGIMDDDDFPLYESGEDSSSPSATDSLLENNKGWAKVRGKGRGRLSTGHIGRGLGLMCPLAQSSFGSLHDPSSKPAASKGPRMPDGTRGFTMGRGKPLTPHID